jgi:hypothetical protein
MTKTQPPHSRESEEALIGSLLIDGSHITLPVTPEDFFIKRYGVVWKAAQTIHDHGDPIDWVTLHAELERLGKVQEVDISHLMGLQNNTPSSIHAPGYAKTIKDLSIRRKILNLASGLAKGAYNLEKPLDGSVSGVLDELETLFSIQTDERFIIRTAAEALQPQPPIDWIIERLFSAGSVSLVVGDPGAKKTYSMIHAGVCVAAGKSWLDFTTRQCKVLFVDEESGERRMARRLGKVLRGEFADEQTPFEYISLAQLNLRDSGDTALLHTLIDKTGAEFVILDALADIMPGADENAVKDVHPVFMGLRKIADKTSAAMVIIHHANKAGGYRGSTAISGAVDLLLMVESKNDKPHIEFETAKARDIEPFKFAAEAHFSEGQAWLTPTEPRENIAQMGKAQEYVLRYLKENGAAYVTNIMHNADTCTANGARQAVYSLTSTGYTQRVDGGGITEKAQYDLTEKGRLYVGIQE